MKAEFKRVPAIEKCFSIPGLLAEAKDALGISDIAKALTYKEVPFLILPTPSQISESLKKESKINFILEPNCMYWAWYRLGHGGIYRRYTRFYNFLEPHSRIVPSSYLGRGPERPDQRWTHCFPLRVFERNRNENRGPLCPDMSPVVITCELSNPKIGLWEKPKKTQKRTGWTILHARH